MSNSAIHADSHSSSHSATSQMFFDAASRFCSQNLAGLRNEPARHLTDAERVELIEKACALGLLEQPDGEGFLWSGLEDNDRIQDGMQILRIIASFHAGVAFCFHQRALGNHLSAQLRVANPCANSTVWLPGGHLLGEPALVRYLATGQCGENIQQVFASSGEPISWSADEAATHLFVPSFDADRRQVFWHRHEVSALGVSASAALHGLDGCRHYEGIAPYHNAGDDISDTVDNSSLLIELLGLQALGIIAIALGTVQQSYERSHAQACLRVQGGKKICEHDAVRALLAVQRAAIDGVEAMLLSVKSAPHCIADLRRIFSLRLLAHEQLCRAANAAMQIFGGSGYMQDMGLEHIVRDNNQLRVLAGSPENLKLFIAGAEISP